MKKKFVQRAMSYLLSFSIFFCSGSFDLTAIAQGKTEDTVTISVIDYGADKDGIQDSTRAVQKALEAAKQAQEAGVSSVILDFPTGEYNFYQDYALKREYHTSNTNSIENPVKNIGILIEEQKNLTINGNGSMFMMHGNLMSLAVVKSENITLQDFSWDSGAATNSEMTVLNKGRDGTGKKYTDYFIPSNSPYILKGNNIQWVSEKSPYTGEYYWTQTNTHSGWTSIGYNANTKILKRYDPGATPFGFGRTVTKISDNVVRFTYSGNAPLAEEIGFTWEYCNAPMRKTAGAFIWESKDTLIQGVNVHYLNQFGWLTQMSENVTFKECNFMPREETGRISTSYADLIHVSGAKGKILIEDCNFSQALDDPINIHGTFTRVERLLKSNQLEMRYVENQQGGFPQYHVDDQVVFAARDSLLPPDGVEEVYTVTAVVNPFEGGDTTGKYMKVTFDRDLPSTIADKFNASQPKYVAENITYTPTVEIKNNNFTTIPTRGILCTTRKPVLIENNTFYDMAMESIFVSNDSNAWYESGPVRDMIIRNNTFYLTNASMGGQSQSLIHFHPEVYSNALNVNSPVHQNIMIEDNTFYLETAQIGNIVEAESVQNLTFRNNTVKNRHPEIMMTASLSKETLSVGENAFVQVKTTDTKVNQAAFSFTKCNTVNVNGNTFDNGINMRYNNYGSLNLNIQSEIAAGKDNFKKYSASDIKYVSSDPSIVSVSTAGKVRGLKKGTAAIFAIIESDGVTYRSNETTIQVEGTQVSEDSLIITSEDNQVLTSLTDQIQFETNTEGAVTWSLKDPLTGKDSTVGIISGEGLFTPKANGIALVTAAAGSAEARCAIVVSVPTVNKQLITPFEFSQESPENWLAGQAASDITLKMETGDLYDIDNGGGAGVKNLLLYTAPDNLDKNDFWVMVDMDNIPRKSGQSLTASFLLYKDNDNYVSVGKKGHMNGITSVTESAGAAVEKPGNEAQNSVTNASFALHKSGNTVETYYKVQDGSWILSHTLNNEALGTDYRVAMAVWAPAGYNDAVTFRNFKVASGITEVSQLETLDPVNILSVTDTPPLVKDYTFDKESYNTNETITVNYQYDSITDPGSVIYRWDLADKNNHIDTEYTSAPTYIAHTPGQLTCTIYFADQNHYNALPVTTDSVQILTSETPEEPEVPVDIKSSNTDLKSVEIPELSVVSNGSGLRFYDAEGVSNVTLNLKAAEPNSNITVSYGYYKTAMENKSTDTSAFSGTLPVFPGTNTAYILVTAENGISAKEYVLNISSIGQTEAGISNIYLNNKALDNFDMETDTYIYRSGTAMSEITIKAESPYENNKTIISTEGSSSIGNEAVIPLKPGKNTIYVGNVAKDTVKKKIYEIQIFVPNPSNSSLIKLSVNGNVKEFDQNTLEYTKEISGTSMELDIKAQEEDATVNVRYTNLTKTGKGEVKGRIPVYGGTYDMLVTVTSPDLKNKTEYLVHINCSGKVYVSDIDLTETEYFERHYRKDFAISEDTPTNPLQLLDEHGKTVTYEKGIGVQATNILECSIEGRGFSNLTGLVGIDYYQFGKNSNGHNESSASITFQIFLDDAPHPVFDSGVMYHDTPGKAFNIDVTKAKKVTFKALSGTYTWYDHGDWADAVFSTQVNEYTPLEKTELITLLQDAINLLSQTSSYTPESLKQLEIQVAKSTGISEDIYASNDEIENAVKAVQEAIDKLVRIIVDKTALQAMITKGTELLTQSEVYTKDSLETLKIQLDRAALVNADTSATQVQVDSAVKNIQIAIENLTQIPQPPKKTEVTAANITAISNKAHTGKAIRPTIAVQGYKEGIDYTLGYRNNVNPGTATIVITFCGNYYGTLNKTFTIAATKNRTYKSGSYYFKVTNSSIKSGTAALTKPVKSTYTSVKIPDYVKIGNYKYKVTQIGAKAFKNNKKIKSVSMGKYVEKINSEAFYGCKGLKKISLGSRITYLGYSSFRNCTSLTDFSISTGLKKIGRYCFYGDKKLKSITFRSKKISTVDSRIFSGINKSAKIKVPSSKLNTYKKLFKGKGQKSTVKIVKY